MKPLKLLLLLLVLPVVLNAQKLEGGIFLGGSNYQGDVVATDIYEFSETNFAYGLVIRNSFNPKWALRGNLLFGKITGTDLNFSDPAWRQNRAFSFESPLTEIALQLEWSPLAKDWMNEDGTFQKSWSPYLFAGLGAAFFDPTPDFNESPDMPAGVQSNINTDKNADFSKVGIAIPLGFGLKFDLSEKAILGLEAGFRPPLTDYLDGISVAANPDKNDWYGFGGATLTFRLGNSAPKEVPPVVTDADNDGVPDAQDMCPTVAGKAMFAGCPDTDNDGVADKDDACPTISGTLAGCPDSDGDGIADKDDRCPNEKGIAAEGGCPKKEVVVDTDGDGIVDKEDGCPTIAGARMFNGCPDTDGDGIEDRKDNCPNQAGIAKYGGCADGDTDGDGIMDSKDNCPSKAGIAANNGCPGIAAADKATIDFAIKNIRFETSRSVFKTESFSIMNQIVDVLNRYPSYSLRISGHTDSVGDSASNQRLSEKRAKACYDYLAGKGISPSRLSYAGYGESRPVASNSSSEGRRQNRRVEFELFQR